MPLGVSHPGFKFTAHDKFRSLYCMESLNSQQRNTGADSGVAPPPVFKLGFGMKFEDLYSCDGLPRIDS
ncbi:MAG: hypothetical protein NTV37_03305, partial [Proteobacteria bacterium]|nr:hypothetical protein [Pseudomonadota bacterium]